MILRICHCGHDISTHHEQVHTCLGMLCDCTSYRDRDIPLPKPVPKSKAIQMPPPDDGDPPPSTLRVPHPQWCLCSVCMLGGTP